MISENTNYQLTLHPPPADSSPQEPLYDPDALLPETPPLILPDTEQETVSPDITSNKVPDKPALMLPPADMDPEIPTVPFGPDIAPLTAPPPRLSVKVITNGKFKSGGFLFQKENPACSTPGPLRTGVLSRGWRGVRLAVVSSLEAQPSCLAWGRAFLVSVYGPLSTHGVTVRAPYRHPSLHLVGE